MMKILADGWPIHDKNGIAEGNNQFWSMCCAQSYSLEQTEYTIFYRDGIM